MVDEPLFDDLDDATFADFEPRTVLTARVSKTRMGDGLIFWGDWFNVLAFGG